MLFTPNSCDGPKRFKLTQAYNFETLKVETLPNYAETVIICRINRNETVFNFVSPFTTSLNSPPTIGKWDSEKKWDLYFGLAGGVDLIVGDSIYKRDGADIEVRFYKVQLYNYPASVSFISTRMHAMIGYPSIYAPNVYLVEGKKTSLYVGLSATVIACVFYISVVVYTFYF